MELISAHSGKSFGGICQLEVYDLSNGIPTMPDVFDQTVAEEITLPSGDWEEIKMIPFTANPIETPEVVDGAVVFGFKMPFTVAKDTGERIAVLYQSTRKTFLVKFTDQNGITKLVGTPDEPASINITSRDNKSRLSNRNEIRMEITCTRREPFPEYPF